MFNRILVPLDGSQLAEQAILHAEYFASIFGSDIILLHVLDPGDVESPQNAVDPLLWQIRKTEIETYLQGVAQRIQNQLDRLSSTGKTDRKRRVEIDIREGKIAENIINFAHAKKVDLLIISSHGSGGLSRSNVSSITMKVINLIYLPVLLIRSYKVPNFRDDTIFYRRILIPIDNSRRSECALPAGIELARGVPAASENAAKTKLELVGVIQPPQIPIPEPYPDEIGKLTAQLLEASRQAAYRYFNDLKERIPVDCDTSVVENTSVAAALHELAERQEVDLVILCAHGQSGQVIWPYGTIARNYIEHGTKSVLVVQDIPLALVKPSAAEIAAEQSGRR